MKSAAKEKASQLRRSHLGHRASGPTRSYLQTRVRASRLLNAARILAFVELTRRLHQAYRQAYDKQAADWLLPQNPAPKGGINIDGKLRPCAKGSPILTINGNTIQTSAGKASIKLDGPSALAFGVINSSNDYSFNLKPNTTLSAELLNDGGYQISSSPSVSIDFTGPNLNLSMVQFNSAGSVSKVKADYLGFGRPISGIMKGQINSALSNAFGPNKGLPVDVVQSLLDTLNKNETGNCLNVTVTVSKP